jgi:PHP domain
MRQRTRPLLAELHAHTTWSDGELSVRELVDLHGTRGFDVLCVTDHVVRSDDPWAVTWGGEARSVPADRYDDYLAEIAHEAERARSLYGLQLVPGLELTFNDLDPSRAAHAVAIGLRTFVPVDDGIDAAIETATVAGAAVIAAHPFSPQGGHPLSRTPSAGEPKSSDGGRSAAVGTRAPRSRLTQRFARDDELRRRVHRFELFNRSTLFGWVADARLPAVACGDVHEPAHLDGWKTLLPCERDEQALVTYLRSGRPTYLTRLDLRPALAA